MRKQLEADAREKQKAAVDAATTAALLSKDAAIRKALADQALKLEKKAAEKQARAKEAARLAEEKIQNSMAAAAQARRVAMVAARVKFKARLDAHVRDSPMHKLEASLLALTGVDPQDVINIVEALRRKKLIRPVSIHNAVRSKKIADILVAHINQMSDADIKLLNTKTIAQITTIAKPSAAENVQRQINAALKRSIQKLEPKLKEVLA